MTRICLNARFRNRPLTGVERFAGEVSARLKESPDLEWSEIEPANPKAGLRGHAWEQWALPRKLDRNAVLFSPCNTGPLSVARQLVVIHDAAVWDCPDAFSPSFRILYQNLLPSLARRVAGVATVSEFSRERLARFLKLPAEKIHVLGNATSGSFSPAPESESDEPPTLLCVASLDPRKNFGRLVEAWASLKASDSLPENARLQIIGSANPANFSRFEAASAPRIEWLGRVSDEELIDRYRHATAFVFPSFYEGFGLPPLEAMACGCPVLLSNKASLPEVGGDGFDPRTPDSKGAAIYFDPLDTTAIADSIEKAFRLDQKQQERLRTNAIKRASQFSWDEVARRTRAILTNI